MPAEMPAVGSAGLASRRSRLGDWPSWAVAIAILVLSRAFSIAVVLGAWALRIPSSPFTPWSAPFSMWDGQWYVWIAGYGYHADAVVHTAYGPGYHDFAFFPAWPMVVRLLSFDGRLPLDAVAPVAANLLFLAAGFAIWTILDRIAGRWNGLWGLALFAFSPGAFVFSVGYSEPLFLLVAALFFIAVERRLEGRAAILAAVAQLTRILGAALAFSLLADLLHPGSRRQAVLVVVATVVAFAGWWIWIAVLTGDPMGYMLGTPSWWLNQRPTPIPVGIASFFDRDQWTDWIALGLLVVTVTGTRWLVQRGQLRLGLYALACIASCALDTQTVMPRLLAIAFPAYVGFAAVLPRTSWRAAVLMVSAGAQVAFGAAVTVRLIVP